MSPNSPWPATAPRCSAASRSSPSATRSAPCGRRGGSAWRCRWSTMAARSSASLPARRRSPATGGPCAPPTEPAAPLFEGGAGPLDARARLGQRLGRGRVGDAEMRAEAKGRPLHHRDALRLEEIFDEVAVVRDPLALRRRAADRPGAGRVDVEGALRLGAEQPLGLVEHVDDKVAALLEDGV